MVQACQDLALLLEALHPCRRPDGGGSYLQRDALMVILFANGFEDGAHPAGPNGAHDAICSELSWPVWLPGRAGHGTVDDATQPRLGRVVVLQKRGDLTGQGGFAGGKLFQPCAALAGREPTRLLEKEFQTFPVDARFSHSYPYERKKPVFRINRSSSPDELRRRSPGSATLRQAAGGGS